MGDGGDGAEVVDERLWSEEDKEAAGKEGMPEEKYEKGGAVQTRPDDDLEFRGADEAEKASEQADKVGEDQQEHTHGNERKEAAEEVPGDAPINTLEPDNVEEAHGIQPEGAACDGEDAAADENEPLELPQDLGIEGDDDGEDAADADADADAGQLGDGDGDAKSDDAAAAGPDFAEEAGDEMEHDSDAGAGQDEAMPSVPDDGDAGAAPDIDQGMAAGSKGFGGSDALNAAQPPDQTPGEPAAARNDGGAHAVGAAGVAPGQLEETAMDEDGERAQVQDSAADAMTAGGGTGGGGGSGNATGGADGLTAPANQSAGGGVARSNPHSLTEPNPYRNLGDALQSWRERLSVRPSVLALLSALSLWHTPPTDVTFPTTLIFRNNAVDLNIFALTGGASECLRCHAARLGHLLTTSASSGGRRRRPADRRPWRRRQPQRRI